MRRIALALLVVSAVAAAVAVALVRGPGPEASRASSHREAPLISNDPAADNTDLYAFVSPDAPNTVTIVANYIPLEQPAGGPNFASFGDDVRYEIKVDNNGDGEEDITYRFRFKTTTEEPEHVPLQHRPDRHAQRPGLERPPDLHGHTDQPRTARRCSERTSASRRSTSDRARRPTTTRSQTRLSQTLTERRCSRASVTTRSTSTSGRSSTWPVCGRSTRSMTSRSANGSGVDGVGGYNTHSIVLQVPIQQA